MTKKYLVHILGFILIAFGVALLFVSEYGLSPYDAMNAHIYKIIDNPYISLGLINTISGLLIICLLAILDPKKDLIISFIMTIILSITFNLFVKILSSFVQIFADDFIIKLIFLIMGTLIVGLGVVLTVMTNLPASPYERLMVYFQKKFNSIFWGKLVIELIFIILAFITSLFVKTTKSLTIYTFVYIIIMPIIISIFSKILIKGESDNEVK